MSMRIDEILAEVVNGSLDAAASVPGVVAIAADSSGVIYEGAAGERRSGVGRGNAHGSGTLDPFYDQAGYRCGVHATGRARQDRPG